MGDKLAVFSQDIFPHGFQIDCPIVVAGEINTIAAPDIHKHIRNIFKRNHIADFINRALRIIHIAIAYYLSHHRIAVVIFPGFYFAHQRLVDDHRETVFFQTVAV